MALCSRGRPRREGPKKLKYLRRAFLIGKPDFDLSNRGRGHFRRRSAVNGKAEGVAHHEEFREVPLSRSLEPQPALRPGGS
jgi:hypothetical protein